MWSAVIPQVSRSPALIDVQVAVPFTATRYHSLTILPETVPAAETVPSAEIVAAKFDPQTAGIRRDQAAAMATQGIRLATIGNDWDDIDAVVRGFGEAAELAVRSGLDGVEVNAGQNSLVRQFLSEPKA